MLEKKNITKKNYGLLRLYNKQSPYYTFLWNFTRKKRIYFFIPLGIALFLDIHSELFPFFPTLIKNCPILYTIFNFVTASRSTMVSASITSFSLLIATTGIVFDGKTIAGMKKETVNKLLDHNLFLSKNKYILPGLTFFVFIAACCNFNACLLLLFLVLIFTVILQLALCLCYSLSKHSIIFDISKIVYMRIIYELSKLVCNIPVRENKRIFKNKTLSEITYPVLVELIYSKLTDRTVSEIQESQHLTMYVIAFLLGNIKPYRQPYNLIKLYKKIYNQVNAKLTIFNRICIIDDFLSFEKSIEAHIINENISALFHPAYMLYYNYFLNTKKSNLLTNNLSKTFVINSIYIALDNIDKYTDTKARADYITRIQYVVSGIIIGSLQGGFPLNEIANVVYRLGCHKNIRYFYSNCDLINNLITLIILWNEDQLLNHDYSAIIMNFDNRDRTEYIQGLFKLIDLIKYPTTNYTYDKNYSATEYSCIEKILYWWELCIRTAPYEREIMGFNTPSQVLLETFNSRIISAEHVKRCMSSNTPEAQPLFTARILHIYQ